MQQGQLFTPPKVVCPLVDKGTGNPLSGKSSTIWVEFPAMFALPDCGHEKQQSLFATLRGVLANLAARDWPKIDPSGILWACAVKFANVTSMYNCHQLISIVHKMIRNISQNSETSDGPKIRQCFQTLRLDPHGPQDLKGTAKALVHCHDSCLMHCRYSPKRKQSNYTRDELGMGVGIKWYE